MSQGAIRTRQRLRAGATTTVLMHATQLAGGLLGAFGATALVGRGLGAWPWDSEAPALALGPGGGLLAAGAVLPFALLAVWALVSPALTALWLASLDHDGGGIGGALRRLRRCFFSAVAMSYLGAAMQAVVAVAGIALLSAVRDDLVENARAADVMALGYLAAGVPIVGVVGAWRDLWVAGIVAGRGIGGAFGRAIRRLLPAIPAFLLLGAVALGFRGIAAVVSSFGTLGQVGAQTALVAATLARAAWLARCRAVMD